MTQKNVLRFYLAAALTAVLIFFGCSAAAVHGVQQTGNGYQVEMVTLTRQNDLVDMMIQYPQFSGMSNASLQESMNRKFQSAYQNRIAEEERRIGDSNAEYPDEPGSYYERTTCQVSDDHGVICVDVNQVAANSWGSDSRRTDSYLFDLNLGRQIYLNDFLKQNPNLKEQLWAEILARPDFNYYGMDEEYLREDLEQTFANGAADSAQGYSYKYADGRFILYEKYGYVSGELDANRIEIGVPVQYESKGITVTLNGTELIFDQPPVVENGRTLVPLRTIFEALGADVNWDQQSQTVTASKGTDTIRLTVGQTIAYKNGAPITLDTAGKVVNGRTLVPVRFIAESLGASVNWDGKAKRVTIDSGDSAPGS